MCYDLIMKKTETKKRFVMCSNLACSKEAVKEIKFDNGCVGEYCEYHYKVRMELRQARIELERKHD